MVGIRYLKSAYYASHESVAYSFLAHGVECISKGDSQKEY